MKTSPKHQRPFWKRRRRFLGIEINDRKIYLADIQLVRDRRVYVHSCLSEQLPVGTVKDGMIQDAEKLVRILRKLVTFSGKLTKKVHLALPAEQVMTQFITLPAVSKRKFEKLLKFELERNVRIPFKDPYYDHIKWKESPRKHEEHQHSDMSHLHLHATADHTEAAAALEPGYEQQTMKQYEGEQYSVLVVSASSKQIHTYENLFKTVKLSPISFEIKPFSLFRLLDYITPVKQDETVLCVDIKDAGVDYSIFQGPVMKLARNVPLEVDDLSDQSLVTDALERELSRLINFYRYNLNHRDEHVAHIFLSGEVQALPDIANELTERLSIHTTQLVPEKIKFADGQMEAQFSEFAAAIGLALRGDQR